MICGIKPLIPGLRVWNNVCSAAWIWQRRSKGLDAPADGHSSQISNRGILAQLLIDRRYACLRSLIQRE